MTSLAVPDQLFFELPATPPSSRPDYRSSAVPRPTDSSSVSLMLPAASPLVHPGAVRHRAAPSDVQIDVSVVVLADTQADGWVEPPDMVDPLPIGGTSDGGSDGQPDDHLAAAPYTSSMTEAVIDATTELTARGNRARARKRSRAESRKASIAREDDEAHTVFRTYLADMEKYPVLSPERERELGELILASGATKVETPAVQEGEACVVEQLVADLTGAELADLMIALEDREHALPGSTTGLLELLQRREHAVHELVVHNLRFGIHKAKRYRGMGVPLMDLVSAANEGLMHAARKFDPARGRFTTYAAQWIQQYVLKVLAEQGRVLRVPTWIQSDVRKLARTHLAMTEELGRQPSVEELAERLSLKTAKVADLLVFLNGSVSLDGSAQNGSSSGSDTTTVGEILTGDTDLSAQSAADVRCDARDQLVALHRVLRRILTEQEVKIVRLYYRLDGGREMTFAEIGAEVGLCREQARKLCRGALVKLQASDGAEILREFWLDM